MKRIFQRSCGKVMGTSKGRKRKASEATSTEDVLDLPDGWMQKLLALGPDLTHILGALANEGKVSASHIKKARTGQPSLQWSELAPSFDLPDDLTMARRRFDSFSIDAVLLPPSFHETNAEVAWRIQDVYQERLSHNSEEARFRVFDTV
jgi:hypothetical protein